MNDPIAYASDGGTIACGDGPELLLYRVDGAPDYKIFTDGILVGVGIVVDRLVTVDDRGMVCWRRRGNGELIDEVAIQGTPTGMALSSDGAVAVSTDAGVWLLRPGMPPTLVAIQWVSAMSWGPDGNSLGVGTRSGAFAAIDPHSGVPWGTVQLGATVEGVGWSRLGHWVVSSGSVLSMVVGDGTAVERMLDASEPLGRLSVSHDGLVAAVLRGQHVAVYELASFSACGALEFRRELAEVCFGPAFWLAVGLDDGDATLVELLVGTPNRTEPHPGRARNVWAMDNKVDRDRLRGAVASHRAGGQPIAKWVRPKEEEKPEGSGCWRSAAMVGCFTLLGLLVCSGLIGLAYYGQQVGWF